MPIAYIRKHLQVVIFITITSSDDIQPSTVVFRSMTMQIIMWTLTLLDTEHSTAKALQVGPKLDLFVG